MTGTRRPRLEPRMAVSVPLGGVGERVDGREVAERLGELAGRRASSARTSSTSLVDDLLLEQRRQDDRPDAGLLEAHRVGQVGVARAPAEATMRRPQVEPEVAGSQIDAHARGLPSLAAGDVRHGAFDAGELLVVVPALVDVGLARARPARRRARGAVRASIAKRASARGEVRDRHRRRGASRAGTGDRPRLGRVVAVERPVAAPHGVLLVASSTCSCRCRGRCTCSRRSRATGPARPRPRAAPSRSGRRCAPSATWAT